jgi:cytoskeleton-associated protein 5
VSEDQPTIPAPPVRKPAPSVPSAKPAPTAAPTKSAAKAGGSSAKTLAVSPSEPVKYRYTSEDAASKAADIIPADYHTKLADGAWKVRLEAAEQMVQWVDEDGGEQIDSEVLFRFLAKTPGWGEKNFQASHDSPSSTPDMPDAVGLG